MASKVRLSTLLVSILLTVLKWTGINVLLQDRFLSEHSNKKIRIKGHGIKFDLHH